MGSQFFRFQAGEHVEYGDIEGIWVMLVRGRPTHEDVLLSRPSLTEMKRRHPGGFPTLTWVLPEAGVSMDEPARHAASAITSEFADLIRADATVIEMGGFQGAAIRAIVTSIALMTRSPAPRKAFATLGEAIPFCLSRSSSPDASVAEVVGALEAERASAPSTPPTGSSVLGGSLS